MMQYSETDLGQDWFRLGNKPLHATYVDLSLMGFCYASQSKFIESAHEFNQ